MHTVIGWAGASILGGAPRRIRSDNLRDWCTGYTIVGAGGLLWFWTELRSVELIHAHAEIATAALRGIISAANEAV